MRQEDNGPRVIDGGLDGNYRLDAVGHLFEAEDETQEWPELHATIRDARTRLPCEGGDAGLAVFLDAMLTVERERVTQ